MKFSFQLALGPWVWGAALVLAALLFLFLQARAFLLPPWILFLNLPAETAVSLDSVTLSGRVYGAKNLAANGKKVEIGRRGRFEESLHLFPGLNIIELRAGNYLGKETVVRRYILYQNTTKYE